MQRGGSLSAYLIGVLGAACIMYAVFTAARMGWLDRAGTSIHSLSMQGRSWVGTLETVAENAARRLTASLGALETMATHALQRVSEGHGIASNIGNAVSKQRDFASDQLQGHQKRLGAGGNGGRSSRN